MYSMYHREAREQDQTLLKDLRHKDREGFAAAPLPKE